MPSCPPQTTVLPRRSTIGTNDQRPFPRPTYRQSEIEAGLLEGVWSGESSEVGIMLQHSKQLAQQSLHACNALIASNHKSCIIAIIEWLDALNGLQGVWSVCFEWFARRVECVL